MIRRFKETSFSSKFWRCSLIVSTPQFDANKAHQGRPSGTAGQWAQAQSLLNKVSGNDFREGKIARKENQRPLLDIA
jgi:hypothetical protein